MTAIPLAGSVYIELYDPPEVRKARQKKQSGWAWQSYMGYSFESFSTKTNNQSSSEVDGDGENMPEGWSGDVNTNVQVGKLRSTPVGVCDVRADGSVVQVSLTIVGFYQLELTEQCCPICHR